MSESLATQRLVRALKRRGIWAWKLNDAATAGRPDLLLLGSGGQMLFAEVKAVRTFREDARTKLSSVQRETLAALSARGHLVYLLSFAGGMSWGIERFIRDPEHTRISLGISEVAEYFERVFLRGGVA